jgi:lipopolysaccharide transport system ATP-binding protein
MPDTVIKVENLSKEYRLGTISHGTLYRDLQSWWATLRGKEDPNSKIATSDFKVQSSRFMALDDVSFDVKQGEALGVIGRNGAGKSTLFKIISQVTSPTKGKVKINGRIVSLLEVGTGFHPELTGRENIYLNGAILGMTKKEINGKYEEIVDFAEIEAFIDTPVKRYSSGMYVRLAFAVAANLDPEILIVDEVLAVGDAQFQKKCLGKMSDVGKEGRTVLFVSHNMNAIEQLCTSCIVLDKGQLAANSSNIRDVINRYLFEKTDQQNISKWVKTNGDFSNPWFDPLSCTITDMHGNPIEMPLSNSRDMWVQIEAEIKEMDPALTMGYALYSEEGHLLYWSYQTDVSEENWPIMKIGINKWRSKISAHYLNEGCYRLEVIGGLHFREWILEPGKKTPHVEFQISGGLSDSPYWIARRPGILAPVIKWEIY